MKKNTLVVLVGPTGVGKTNISLRLARHLDASIVSSDSRQFYRELKIGTAAPTPEQLAYVPHHFIGSHSIFDQYNSGEYERDALKLLKEEFKKRDTIMLVGGSMMYIDALCNGIDDIPAIDETTRHYWFKQYEEQGLEYIQKKLAELDPQYYQEVDLMNHKRILHALEICSISKQAYSNLRTGKLKERPFNILKIGLNRPREELYERINKRVDEMIEAGLLEEAKNFYEHRHLNTLNTVGYKELYEYISGNCTLEFAIEKIKQDTRRYAKRQLTWFNRDKSIHWFSPENEDEILKFVDSYLQNKYTQQQQ